MKKIVSIFLVFSLALILHACTASSTGTPPKTSIKIGVSIYDQYDTFVGVLMDCFTYFAREKELESEITIAISRQSAGGSQIAQNTQVENFIKEGCDILCVNLVDRTDVSIIIEKAAAAGIPIIFFNRELVEEDLQRWDNLYYVGAAAGDSGAKQGQMLLDICEKEFASVDKSKDGVIQYVMLEGEAGHQDAIVRTEVSVSTVQDAGYQLERLEDEIANWSKAQAETKMAQWILKHGQSIEVVFANNDDMALGAIEALGKSTLTREQWPLVFGIDGTPPGLEAILRGDMAGSVLNDAMGQADGMLQIAFSLSTKASLPSGIDLQNKKYFRLPYKTITIENAQEFLDIYRDMRQ